jgi:hypothetical protein
MSSRHRHRWEWQSKVRVVLRTGWVIQVGETAAFWLGVGTVSGADTFVSRQFPRAIWAYSFASSAGILRRLLNGDNDIADLQYQPNPLFIFFVPPRGGAVFDGAAPGRSIPLLPAAGDRAGCYSLLCYGSFCRRCGFSAFDPFPSTFRPADALTLTSRTPYRENLSPGLRFSGWRPSEPWIGPHSLTLIISCSSFLPDD